MTEPTEQSKQQELRTLQRYEIALRRSNVTVFTQDRDLRYTSISNPFLGHEVAQIVGRSDDEIIPAENRFSIIAIKREVLEKGLPAGCEVQIKDRGVARWFELHIEPLRDAKNAIVGLTCVAVDITARKESAEHLVMLTRELTHRSKNLLALIQAIARQTARYTRSIDAFIEQFSARVQALARSHDLLVEEGWHGASLDDLVKSQLGPYRNQNESRISIGGPPLRLKPEAAQSLGLALHELAANAAQHGALAVPSGRVSITWTKRPSEDEGVEILWTESGAAIDGVPKKRGFGSLVVERNLTRALDSEVDLKYAEGGVHCRITIPEKHLFSVAEKDGAGNPGGT
jgi:PAS domain S-box-containing protein